MKKTMKAVLEEVPINGSDKYEEKNLEIEEELEELNRSYSSLAEKYDRLLRTKIHSGSSSFTNEIFDFRSRSRSIVEDGENSSVAASFKYMNKLADDLISSELYSTNINNNVVYDELDKKWSEIRFQVTKLMEENLRQQAELLKRNSEKKATIKRLQIQVERLETENKELWSRFTPKHTKYRLPSLGRLFSAKGCRSFDV